MTRKKEQMNYPQMTQMTQILEAMIVLVPSGPLQRTISICGHL